MYMGLPLSTPRMRASHSGDADVPLSRHVPRLRTLLDEALAGVMNDDEFPYADGGPSDHDAADPFRSPTSTLPSPRGLEIARGIGKANTKQCQSAAAL